MIILGLSPLDKDATVSLLINGEIIFAAGEERFSRVKQQSGFPKQAIEAALNYAGIQISDVDVIAYPFLEAKQESHLIQKNYDSLLKQDFIQSDTLPDREDKKRDPVPGLQDPNEKVKKPAHHSVVYQLLGKPSQRSHWYSRRAFKKWCTGSKKSFLKHDETLSRGLQKLGYSGELKRVDHHRSHAANAFYGSGYDRALIVTLDGYGTGQAGSVSLGENGKITLLNKIDYPHSLGLMYEQVTSALGFKPSRHEGKIVGLAAYGDPSRLGPYILSTLAIKEGKFKFDSPHNPYFARFLASKYPKIDVAAGFQWALEKVSCDYISYYVKKFQVSRIVLSGGVIANVKLNQRIYEIEGVDKIFVYPNMGDGGCATGAAMLVSAANGEKPSFKSAYLGLEYDDEYIQTSLDEAGLVYEKIEYSPSKVATLIKEGNVVARFGGRMEYGPRALGNRSILYHGKDVGVNKWLNKRLGRTEFMPFAPVVLAEDADYYFSNSQGVLETGEFMTVTLNCKAPMNEDCPAAVHIDNTARPQFITKERNPFYYDVVSAYKSISGSGAIINTSFNMHEEPIVMTPEDAIRAYKLSNLDALSIGNFLVKKAHQAK